MSAVAIMVTGGARYVGTGTGWSVKQAVEMAARVTGRTIPVTVAPRRPGDSPALVADPTAARRLLGWAPARAGLDVQIADAWAWHQKPKPGVPDHATDPDHSRL